MLFKLHLPQATGHVPAVLSFDVGELRVHLLIVLGIPHHGALIQVAIHILHLFFIVAGGGDALQTVAAHTLVDIARGVARRFRLQVTLQLHGTVQVGSAVYLAVPATQGAVGHLPVGHRRFGVGRYALQP